MFLRRFASTSFLPLTKSPQRSRKGAEEDLEKSLRVLKTDDLDLWQIHQVTGMGEVQQISLQVGPSVAMIIPRPWARLCPWPFCIPMH
jgi:aryl-alcohol dehydrogenase-like predicted oxidoreductase